jgi:hypothetical protein
LLARRTSPDPHAEVECREALEARDARASGIEPCGATATL